MTDPKGINPIKSGSSIRFNIVNRSPVEVVEYMSMVLNSNYEHSCGRRYEKQKLLEFDLKDVYPPKEEDGVYEPLRAVFWSPLSNKDINSCAFVSNRLDGMGFTVFKMAQGSPWRWIRVGLSDSPEDYWHECSMAYFEKNLEIERIISVAEGEQKGQWSYYTKGAPLFFEDSAYATRRKKKDRFRREILISYLAVLGYDIEADSFWVPLSGEGFQFRELKAKS